MPDYDPGWPPTGPPSYPEVIEIARHSGTVILSSSSGDHTYGGDNVPGKIRVTSTRRPGNTDFHNYGLATDFASGMDDAGQRLMQKHAAWWYQYSDWLLELIHTTPYPTDNGYYVKRGQRVGPELYGANVVGAHLNHVHVAMSDRAAAELLARLNRVTPRPTPPPVPVRRRLPSAIRFAIRG
jgi:hypothetical protein